MIIQTTLLLVLTISSLALVGLLYFFGQQFITSQKAYQCGQNYRYTVIQKDGTTVSYPMVEEYQDCIN